MRTLGIVFAIAASGACDGADDHRVDPVDHAHHAAHASHQSAAPEGAAHSTHHEGHTAMAAGQVVPGTSLAQLDSTFSDSAGNAFAFSSLLGHPTVVTMFYGSCETVCPILLDDVRAIDAALSPEVRANVRYLLVTFDPTRDTPERLRALATEKHMDDPRYTYLRGDEEGIRTLSMVLGVQYRRLPDGNFAHSALITLLDDQATVVERIEGLRAPNDALVARLRDPH